MATSIPLNNGAGFIPSVGLGTWTVFGTQGDPGELERAVCYAIDAGYRHIDCAWAYKTQPEVGRALKTKIEDGTVRRADMFITTKLWPTHYRQDRVMEELKHSLKSLQTDYVDMFLIHWPTAFTDQDMSGTELGEKDEKGNLIPGEYALEDVWKAMEDCQKAGLTKNIGLSNFNCKQVDRIMKSCTIKPSNIQIEIWPYFSNTRLRDYCQSLGIVVTAYCPIGSPSSATATQEGVNVFEDKVIKDIAKKTGKTVAQVMLRSHVQRGIVVVPKSVNPKRIMENIELFDFSLTEEEMLAMANLNRNFKICKQCLPNCYDHPEFPFNEPL